MAKLHIKKGDTVYVNAGASKGKTGRVLEVLVEKQRAIVEGVNMVSKSTKPNAKNPQGGIVKQEAPIHISNLNPVENGAGNRADHRKLFRLIVKMQQEGRIKFTQLILEGDGRWLHISYVPGNLKCQVIDA